jgi:hypothetical protein
MGWPEIKRALVFAWVEGGWDADRDGVMEGVQHNTYDVEFFGPNPMCGIYYLGALRAGEEMARAMGDPAAAVYRGLFEKGRAWIDANLFNGEYYIQKVRGVAKERIARDLLSTFGSDSTEKPDFQLGEGCLVDQLVGQYVADFAGLGPLVDPAKIRKTLESIYKYNYKRELFEHESVQRIFALNDEAALVICDYGRGKRPRVPFPYFAEVMTGFEYSAAVLMLWHGMVDQGIECIANIRRRYDGERRNPWDEAECGHHYARAMAAWSAVLALSGFRYHGRVDSSLPARQLPLVLVHGHRMGEFHPQRAERRTEPENRRGRGPPRSAQHRHRCAGRIGSIQSPRHPRRSRDNRARNAETGPLAPRLGQRLSSGTEGWGRHRAGPAILEQRTLKRPSLRRGSKTASTPRNRTSGSRFATLASINWIARSEWPSPVSTMAA